MKNGRDPAWQGPPSHGELVGELDDRGEPVGTWTARHPDGSPGLCVEFVEGKLLLPLHVLGILLIVLLCLAGLFFLGRDILVMLF